MINRGRTGSIIPLQYLASVGIALVSNCKASADSWHLMASHCFAFHSSIDECLQLQLPNLFVCFASSYIPLRLVQLLVKISPRPRFGAIWPDQPKAIQAINLRHRHLIKGFQGNKWLYTISYQSGLPNPKCVQQIKPLDYTAVSIPFSPGLPECKDRQSIPKKILD